MKNIQIQQLVLENFKCHAHLTLDFRGKNASVFGDNATGKTSIYDALTWLLFSKDSQGNGEKNVEIKPLDERGEVKDHTAVTSVEAVLLVDGQELTLRRTYQEVWTTKRGSAEATYDGNTSEYYIDGVPCKKFAFAEKVSELVDEDTFRMLTNVSHFANAISWQDRRAVLFKVTNVPDDAQLMAGNETFLPLIEGRGRLSIEDYKKKLLADRKGLVGAKNEIPARISECQKTIADVETLDFSGVKTELDAFNAQKERLEEQILSMEHNHAVEQKHMEAREACLALDALESENRVFRAGQTAGIVNVSELQNQISRLQTQRKEKDTRLSYARDSMMDMEKDISDIREKWITTNNETFTSRSCPTCGQTLPEAQRKAASEIFEAKKRRRLQEIEQIANAKKETRGQMEERVAELIKEIEEMKREIAEKEESLQQAEAATVEIKDMPNYEEKRKALQERVNLLSGELADWMADTSAARSNLQAALLDVKAEIAQRMEILSKEALLAYSRKRVEALKEDAKNTAERVDAIERMLDLIDEYARYKARFVEDSINSHFRLAKFRLFREQANGGLEDRCDVVCDGVPYINVNNGAKINLGIDIINTLSKAYGVRVPLFVDNAESVTRLEPFDGQIIRLAVSEKDKELRVSYEN